MDLNNKEKVCNLIKKKITEYPTDAIYMFGSYGTEFFDKNSSDIDIAWFTDKDSYIDNLEDLQIELGELVGVPVNIVEGFRLSEKLLMEVLQGELLTPDYSERFSKYFDDVYDKYIDDYKDYQNMLYYYDED